jgi:hypothetical protein
VIRGKEGQRRLLGVFGIPRRAVGVNLWVGGDLEEENDDLNRATCGSAGTSKRKTTISTEPRLGGITFT